MRIIKNSPLGNVFSFRIDRYVMKDRLINSRFECFAGVKRRNALSAGIVNRREARRVAFAGVELVGRVVSIMDTLNAHTLFQLYCVGRCKRIVRFPD